MKLSLPRSISQELDHWKAQWEGTRQPSRQNCVEHISRIILQSPCTAAHLPNDHVEPSSLVLDQNKFSLFLICSSVLFFYLSVYSCCLHNTRKWRMTAGFLRQSVCSGRASPEQKNVLLVTVLYKAVIRIQRWNSWTQFDKGLESFAPCFSRSLLLAPF
jgi:hypothetical protein